MPLAVVGDECGARNRNEDATGPTCKNPKGFRTDHPGQGPCFLHGGMARITHGRYSKIKRRALAELIQEYKEDPEILNMEPELATARALFEDYVNRYDEITEALIAWWQSYKEVMVTKERLDPIRAIVFRYEQLWEKDSDAPEFMGTKIKAARDLLHKWKEYFDNAANFKPIQVLDVAESYKFLAEITKIVERIEKVRAQNAISRRNFQRVTNQMGQAVNQICDNMSMSVQLYDVVGNRIKVYDAAGNELDVSGMFQEVKKKVVENWNTIQVQQ
jgi:hypothetical protein